MAQAERAKKDEEDRRKTAYIEYLKKVCKGRPKVTMQALEGVSSFLLMGSCKDVFTPTKRSDSGVYSVHIGILPVVCLWSQITPPKRLNRLKSGHH